VIQQQHTPTVDLIETELIDGMNSLLLAILLNDIDFCVPVDLVDPSLNIVVVVV